MKKNRKLSEATKRKISAAQKGKNNSMYGKRHTQAALLKITRASRGENNPMFGKNHSVETRKKISLLARLRWSRIKKGKGAAKRLIG